MKRIAKYHKIITLFKFLPGYVEDSFSGEIFLIWGWYYRYIEYRYDRAWCDGSMERKVARSAVFVNREDAENYSKRRNENTLPC